MNSVINQRNMNGIHHRVAMIYESENEIAAKTQFLFEKELIFCEKKGAVFAPIYHVRVLMIFGSMPPPPLIIRYWKNNYLFLN